MERQNFILDISGLNQLLGALKTRGYRTVGPTVRDGAIIYDEIEGVSDLPEGWRDSQGQGFYQLTKRNDAALFGYNAGPHSWKKFLFPPEIRLWEARKTPLPQDGHPKKTGNNFEIVPEKCEDLKYAFIGVRSCELHAILIQDKVFLKGPYTDSSYASRRKNIFILAVNCTQTSENCFCESMKTGPRLRDEGYDLALTELLRNGRQEFLVETHTPLGFEILKGVQKKNAEDSDLEAQCQLLESVSSQFRKKVKAESIKEGLVQNPDHPAWDDVAERCLSCANCTMVCPTCFCSTVEDLTDLTGEHAQRRRRWDSCFTLNHSYIHGGSMRPSSKSRYRQWLTHKFSYWMDQFDVSGCVGCGRCIAWCPAAIDVTEELEKICYKGETHANT